MKPVVFLASARGDLRATRAHYQRIDPSLATRFALAVEHASAAMAQFPLAMQILDAEIRRWPVQGFPHGILYRVEESRIVIVSVFHPKLDPAHWLRRVNSSQN